MRVLCVNRYFWPDHSATSQLLSDLAFQLAAHGVAVTVITSRQHYDDAAASLPPHEVERGVRVLRVWSTRFGRSGLAGRALDYLSFYASVFWALLWYTRAGDVVLSKTDPPMVGVVAAVLARGRRLHRVNWLQDIFPEVAQAAGLPVVQGRLGRFAQGLRDWSLRGARNVVLGERMAAVLRARGVGAVSVIHNWADGSAIRPLPAADNPLRAQWGLAGKFVVGYSGNLGRVHDVSAIVAAAELLREHHEVVFLFVGGGNRSETLHGEVMRRGLDNVVFQAYQPRELLGQSLTVPDVHLVSLSPAFEGLVVPSKFYGIAAAGRACVFIGDDDGEIARLLREGECGLTVAEGDGAALAAAILALHADPARCDAMGAAARRLFEARYDMPVALARWDAVLQQAAAGAVG